MDKDDFRRLTGGKEEAKESLEEAQAREERIEKGNPLLKDIIAMMPSMMRLNLKDNQDRYGLTLPCPEEEAQHHEAMRALLSEEQFKQGRRAEDAYRKRRLPIQDPGDPMNNLLTFAATNPPEVLRKHIWRLQRGMDEPMFGTELPAVPARVRKYTASRRVTLCDNCAEELLAETEAAGAERPMRSSKATENCFYDVGRDAPHGYYLFRYAELYVEMESQRGLSQFPYEAPHTCQRCGLSDVDYWQQPYG